MRFSSSLLFVPLFALLAVAGTIPSDDAPPSKWTADDLIEAKDMRTLDYWSPEDLKNSKYRDNAKQFGKVYSVVNNGIVLQDLPSDLKPYDADHVFEAQMGAAVLNFMRVPVNKTTTFIAKYRTILNGEGNMRFVTKSVNGKKGSCVVALLNRQDTWECNDHLVNEYVKLVATPMRATAEALDLLFDDPKFYHLAEAELILNRLGALQPSGHPDLTLAEANELEGDGENRVEESYVQAILSRVTRWWFSL